MIENGHLNDLVMQQKRDFDENLKELNEKVFFSRLGFKLNKIGLFNFFFSNKK